MTIGTLVLPNKKLDPLREGCFIQLTEEHVLYTFSGYLNVSYTELFDDYMLNRNFSSDNITRDFWIFT